MKASFEVNKSIFCKDAVLTTILRFDRILHDYNILEKEDSLIVEMDVDDVDEDLLQKEFKLYLILDQMQTTNKQTNDEIRKELVRAAFSPLK